jgi:hypothetical protein
MRWRVDKVERVVWLLLKLVMEAKNRRPKKKVHKSKRMGEGLIPKGTHWRRKTRER